MASRRPAQHQHPGVPAVRQLGQQVPQAGVGVEGERVLLAAMGGSACSPACSRCGAMMKALVGRTLAAVAYNA
jgi:hypothetical protein